MRPAGVGPSGRALWCAADLPQHRRKHAAGIAGRQARMQIKPCWPEVRRIGVIVPTAGTTPLRRSPLATLLSQVANFDEIAVGVAEVDGQYRTRRSGPLIWSFDYVDALPVQMSDNFIHRCVRQQTEIAAARHSAVGESRCCSCILKADLIRAEVKRPLARPLLARCHSKDAFVKLARRRDVIDAKHNVIERAHFHDGTIRLAMRKIEGPACPIPEPCR
jgi:hypothetical protein